MEFSFSLVFFTNLEVNFVKCDNGDLIPTTF
jgi:hypothetical protein